MYIHTCSVIHIFSYTYTYIYILILFHYVLSQDIEYSSVLYSRILLLIYSVYNSLHLSVPNFQPVPPHPWHPQDFSVCVNIISKPHNNYEVEIISVSNLKVSNESLGMLKDLQKFT